MTSKACSRCGQVTTGAARCPDCQPAEDRRQDRRRGSRHARGYDNVWARLSERARRLQPWCQDCGAVDDLTLDHLPGAWERTAAGKPLRLGTDVEVVCRNCNNRRGPARGPRATRGDTPERDREGPPGRQNPCHTRTVLTSRRLRGDR